MNMAQLARKKSDINKMNIETNKIKKSIFTKILEATEKGEYSIEVYVPNECLDEIMHFFTQEGFTVYSMRKVHSSLETMEASKNDPCKLSISW